MSIIRIIYIWLTLKNTDSGTERQFVLPSNFVELPKGWEFTNKRDNDEFNKTAKGYAREKVK
jgi:hypothetical protein